SNRNRERDLDILSREKNFPFIETISRRTAGHRQKEHRETGSEIGHSQQERFVRERAHHVTLSHHLHPRSRIGDRAANDITAKRTRSQNTQCVTSRYFHIRAHPNTQPCRGVCVKRPVVDSSLPNCLCGSVHYLE